MFKTLSLIATIIFFAGTGLAQPGSLDRSFGFDGHSKTGLTGGGNDQVYAAVVQPDGKTIVVGRSRDDFGLARYNVDGTLDPAFGVDGKVMAAVTGQVNTGRGVALQPDGKIVVVGSGTYTLGSYLPSYHQDFAVARFNSNGTLDRSFGGDGRASTSFDESSAEANGVAVQADGRIVVVGQNGGMRIAIARFKADGSLDESFDGDGKLMTSVALRSNARAVAIQADGKIVVTGSSGREGNGQYPDFYNVFTTLRYLPSGALDPTFADGGIARFARPADAREVATSLAIRPDGKIIVGGSWTTSPLAIARYLPNGLLDSTFGTDGLWIAGPGLGLGYPVLGLQSDMKIAVGGTEWVSNGCCGSTTSRFAAVRLSPDGVLDTSFGTDGKVFTVVGKGKSISAAAAVGPDDRLIVAGHTLNVASPSPFDASPADFGVVRYTTQGSPDTSFSGDGVTTTDVSETGGTIYAVAMQPDRKILVVGIGKAGLAVARYDVGGRLDHSFGSSGQALPVAGTSSYSERQAIALQTDGKIVVAGGTGSPDYRFVVVRFNSDGSPDRTFGEGGKVLATAGGNNEGAVAVAIQSDGKIVIAGRTSTSYHSGQVALLRFNTDGSLDPSFDGDGRVLFAPGPNPGAGAIVIQSDGKIVTAGWTMSYRDFVSRHNVDGALDTSFGNNGIASDLVGTAGGWIRSLALQDDGKILMAGGVWNTFSPDMDIVVCRLRSDGWPDPNFGRAGRLETRVTDGHDSGNAIAVQPDGKFVVGGEIGYVPGALSEIADFVSVRYTRDGFPDLSWGDGSIARAGLMGRSWVNAMLIDPLGRVVVGGESRGLLTLVRFAGDAASHSVSGRVLDVNGRPVAGAQVSLTNAAGDTVTATVGSFGYYRFDDVAAGAGYTARVRSKRHQFEPRNVTVDQDLTDVDFIAQ